MADDRSEPRKTRGNKPGKPSTRSSDRVPTHGKTQAKKLAHKPIPSAMQADAPRRRTYTRDDRDASAANAAARELRLYGINATLAFIAHRRDRVIRGYFTEVAARRHFAPLMKWLAQQRLAYHVVTEAELERITGSAHHEGVCLLVRADEPRTASDWLRDNQSLRRGCVLALENVGNPHNLGAILRTAAHFGISAVLVPDAKALAGGAAVRTAEGGAEHVEVLDAPEFARAVQTFRAAGWKLLTTSSHRGENLFQAALPEKCLLLLGEESTGVTPGMLAAGDACVCIPGTGKVESLNVSVAVGVMLGEWYRRGLPRR